MKNLRIVTLLFAILFLISCVKKEPQDPEAVSSKFQNAETIEQK
jgi:PBP1b-binding outer membrane lipoprotein LpoB